MDERSKPIPGSKEANLDRLEELQIAHCFEIMEHLAMVDIGHNAKLPFKERLQAMIMVNTVRKDARKVTNEPDAAGSKVRKYTKSFANAAHGRSIQTGSGGSVGATGAMGSDHYDDDDAPGANGPTGPS